MVSNATYAIDLLSPFYVALGVYLANIELNRRNFPLTRIAREIK